MCVTRILMILVLFFFPMLSISDTLTAVCLSPKGQTQGTYKGKEINVKDGISKGRLLINWNTQDMNADIESVDSKGVVVKESARLIQRKHDRYSFIYLYDNNGIWLYSFYPEKK